MQKPDMNTPDGAENIENISNENAGDAGLLQKLQADYNALKDQMLRGIADAENRIKRAEKEKEESLKYAVSGFARDLLNVSDNLRRSIDAAKKDDHDGNPAVKSLLSGIEITEKELLGAFEKCGVKKIDPKIGDPFDYNRHQAMFEIESADKPSGIVMQVMQPGYILHDRLLRPALVGVSKSTGAPPQDAAKIDVKA